MLTGTIPVKAMPHVMPICISSATGSSMSFSSAIVGGVLPIAVGAAFSIKQRGGTERVHCFMGEMTSETGIAHECIKYSRNLQLPIRFIVEDNGLSVCTDTRAAWNQNQLTYEAGKDPMIVYYKYKTRYPHAGAGVRVQF